MPESTAPIDPPAIVILLRLHRLGGRATFRDLAPGLAVLFALLLAGCASSERSASPSPIPASSNPSPLAAPDEFSYARPDQTVIRHLNLDLALDFEHRTVAGTLPTYRALAETPETQQWGKAILARARSGLHPITVRAAEDALSKPAHRPAP